MVETSELLDVAREAAFAAGRRVMEVLRSTVETARKADHSLVTNADHEANTLILEALRRSFPEHGILSEETGREGPASSEYVWVVDPLDGTRAFVRGLAGFSVHVGLLKEGRPHAGVVFDPVAQTCFEAQRGQGAFLVGPGRRVPLRVSQRADWLAMPVITSKGFPDQLRRGLEQKCGLSFLEPINSVGVKVGYMVRRLADIYLNHHPVHHWDTCAPLVILEEAGGRMTHWDGTPLSFAAAEGNAHPHPTVATNGVRHDELISLLSSFPKP